MSEFENTLSPNTNGVSNNPTEGIVNPFEQYAQSGDKVFRKKEAEAKIFNLISTGKTFQAYDESKVLIDEFPESIFLKLGIALALIRTGAVSESQKWTIPILESIKANSLKYESAEDEISVLGHLAQIYKESWVYSRVTDHLEISRDLYRQSFNKQPNTGTGVNSAILSWMIGEDKISQEQAYAVIALHEKEINSTNYKSHSDGALAFLILGEIDASLSWYQKALKYVGKGYNPIREMREALSFLQLGGFIVPDKFFELIPAPAVVVFSGPMLDKPYQDVPVFPKEIEPLVRSSIERKINELDAQVGYVSCSCGADIIFAELMIAKGAELNIILPFDQEDFLEHNVRYAGPRWERRFKKVIEQAHTVNYATEDSYLGHNTLYRYANQVMHGTASIRANFIFGKAHLLALWNSRNNHNMGDSTDFVNQWADITTLHLIDLDEILKEYSETVYNQAIAYAESHKSVNVALDGATTVEAILEVQNTRNIKYMLFADMAGYSKMQDEHIPFFFEFVNSLSDSLQKASIKPESLNTWGDAVFAVMNSATHMAEYALFFRDIVKKLSIKYNQVPKPFDARISLHAGPVYVNTDPFLNRNNYYGSHINRAARLEPVTVIGQVYATEQFVALLNAEQSIAEFEAIQSGRKFKPQFITEYVGVISLAKSFGSEPIYHLRWRDS